MDNLFKQKLIDLKIKNKTNIITVNAEAYKTETELLDYIASKIANTPSVIVLQSGKMSDRAFLSLGEKVKFLCAEFEATLIIYNRADIAFLLDADGVYLDEQGITPHQAEHILKEEAIILETLEI